MNTRIFISVFSLVILFSCEEIIQLDLTSTPQKIVIEGMLSDNKKEQYVRITRTTDFYSSENFDWVSDADVRVTSSDGDIFRYRELSSGYYIPTSRITTVVGKSYKLTVRIGNEVYESEEQLLRVTSIDSLGFELADDPSDERKEKGHLYDLLMYFKEPKETVDYYLFKFYRNDSLSYTSSNDIYITSDEALSESINGFPAPVFYAEKDTAYMEMYSLTRNGYLFYSDLTNLQFSDGGLFGPVPANPRSNLSNGALGFFQVSAMTSKEIIISK